MDLRDKRRILKEIDKGFDIEFHNGIYIISHNGGHFETVSHDGFTRELVDKIRRVSYINRNGNIIREIDNHNEKVRASNQKKEDDMIEQTVKDIGKPLYKSLTM